MVGDFLISLEKLFKSSPGLGLAASFLAGLLASLSACIYPLIPVTLAIIGVESASTRLKSFSISLVFVLGIASIYTLLGIISSLAGKLFGSFLVNPFTYLVLALFFFTLGFISLKGITINIPFFSFNYNSNRSKEFLSIFILGAVSGLGIIPCNFPVLGAILSLISLKQNVIYGAAALFIFSLGYGILLIILGTFTGLIRKLPKQGGWFLGVKRMAGLLLIASGTYFLFKFINLIG